MHIDGYLEGIRNQLEAAAEGQGGEARAVAERLVASLDAAIRLALQDALVAAVEEITVELAPGSVEVRLRGREPEFVVTPPPPDPSLGGAEEAEGTISGRWSAGRGAPRDSTVGDEGAMARINLRLPEHLKARIESAADSEALSINSWLVRAAAASLDRTDADRRRDRRGPQGAQRYTGWAR